MFLKKLKVFNLLKYSVDPDKLKDKTYEKFIEIIMDCWKLKLFLRKEGFHFLPLRLDGNSIVYFKFGSSVWLLSMQSERRINLDKAILRDLIFNFTCDIALVTEINVK